MPPPWQITSPGIPGGVHLPEQAVRWGAEGGTCPLHVPANLSGASSPFQSQAGLWSQQAQAAWLPSLWCLSLWTISRLGKQETIKIKCSLWNSLDASLPNQARPGWSTHCSAQKVFSHPSFCTPPSPSRLWKPNSNDTSSMKASMTSPPPTSHKFLRSGFHPSFNI